MDPGRAPRRGPPPGPARRGKRRLAARTREVVDRELKRWTWRETRAEALLRDRIDEVAAGRMSPYDLAGEAGRAGGGARGGGGRGNLPPRDAGRLPWVWGGEVEPVYTPLDLEGTLGDAAELPGI